MKPVYQNSALLIFKCEDLLYPEYKGKYFVLEKSEGYGFFEHPIDFYTAGEILDTFDIQLPPTQIEQYENISIPRKRMENDPS